LCYNVLANIQSARHKALHNCSTIEDVMHKEGFKATDESVWQTSETEHPVALTKMRKCTIRMCTAGTKLNWTYSSDSIGSIKLY